MIRRGFWVVTGAVLGVTGYRRVARLASMLTGPKSAGSRPGPGSAAGPRMLPPPRVRTQAGPGGEAPRRVAPSRVAPSRVAPRSGVRTHVARAVAAAAFVRDVRDGMAEYWDLHRGEPDPVQAGRTLEAQARDTQALELQTLEARADRTSSGVRQQGRREP